MVDIVYAPVTTPLSGAVVVTALAGGAFSPIGARLDADANGVLRRAWNASPRFHGRAREILELIVPLENQPDITRILIVGLGETEEINACHIEEAGGAALARLEQVGVTTATFDGSSPEGVVLSQAMFAARFAHGARLRAWRFETYRHTWREGEVKRVPFSTITLLASPGPADDALQAQADGVFFTRTLVSEPPNVLYPESFAERARRELEPHGVGIEILEPEDLRKLGMNALLGVGQGSMHPPRLAVLTWRGKSSDGPPICIVGKGVTFDSGGLSLKTASGMEDMKWDMGGAGVVAGLLRALAGRKARADVIGILGLAENMPSGNAQRPGDIVRSVSGQTIEVLNTDAEGRLVLADAIWYAQNRFKPSLIVDLATLTGAMIVALGHEYAGLFSNDDVLAKQLSESGAEVGELLWRLPLAAAYDREIDSDSADMKNISGSRSAGAIIAAQFLQRHVNKTKWAHLDIAGVTWSKKSKPLHAKGATSFGVRLLDRFIASYIESA